MSASPAERRAFAERAERAGCVLHGCAERTLAGLEWWTAASGGATARNVAVAPSLLAAFPEAGAALLAAGAQAAAAPERLLHCTAGVSAAVGGVAETGSLLLAGAEPADRLAWLLPAKAFIVLRERDILATLEEALAWFGQRREIGALTLLTGPSRTSDVERVLTIGVQGAREVIVVLVAEEGHDD